MDVEQSKTQLANYFAENLPSMGIIGFGSGSTVNQIIEKIAASKINIRAISASSSTSLKLAQFGIEEITIRSIGNKQIPICVDGADQVIWGNQPLILKGHGGALTREKIMWNLTSKVLVAIDSSKLVDNFTEFIPIEIIPFSLKLVFDQLKQLDIHGLNASLRTYGTSNMPLMTDNNNFIVDIYYTPPLNNPIELNNTLNQLVGIVETGLFVDRSKQNTDIIIGYPDRCQII